MAHVPAHRHVERADTLSVFRRRAAASRFRTSLWLGPIPGLVALALGVLFVTEQKKDGDTGAAPAGARRSTMPTMWQAHA